VCRAARLAADGPPTSLAISLAVEPTQATKPFSSSGGSSRETARLNVSGEGIPSGQLQKPFSYLRLALRWPSISFQLLAPLKTAAINSDKILQGTLHPIAIKVKRGPA
jgi:hypothetical protein